MSSQQSHSGGMMISYVAVFLLALNGLFSKTIALNAVSITQLRSVIAAATILICCLALKRAYTLSSRRDALHVYAIGVLMGLHWVTFFHAMQVSTVAVGMLSLFVFPVITVLLEPLFTGQRLKLGDIVAAMLVLAGIVIIGAEELVQKNGLEETLQGLLWGVLSALFFSLRNLWQKYRLEHISSEKLMLHQLVAIALLLLVFIDFEGVFKVSAMDVLLLFLLSVISTAGAHTLLVASYKRLPAKTVAMISCLQPVSAALMAWWVLQETITAYIFTGGALILSVAVYESVKVKRER